MLRIRPLSISAAWRYACISGWRQKPVYGVELDTHTHTHTHTLSWFAGRSGYQTGGRYDCSGHNNTIYLNRGVDRTVGVKYNIYICICICIYVYILIYGLISLHRINMYYYRIIMYMYVFFLVLDIMYNEFLVTPE